MDKRDTFSMAEIAEAAGVSPTAIYSRYHERVKRGLLPPGQKRLNYEQTKIMLRKLPKHNGPWKNQDAIRALRSQLETDGYPIRKPKARREKP